MVETFNPPMPPQTAPSGEGRFAVQEIQFGDGYVGTFTEGMNGHRRSWPVTYKGSIAEIEEIIAFFIRHRGAVSFIWTPPIGPVGRWRVKSYSPVPEAGDNATLTATFEEFFIP